MNLAPPFFILILLLTGFMVNIAHAQEETRKVERITIPYTAANTDRTNPEHYSFPSKHIANWILNISNELVYDSENPDAKVALRLKDEPTSENYVEVAMFGAPSKTLWLAVNNEQVGNMILYQNENSWFEDKLVMVTYTQNDRLSVNNGQRNIMDRLRIGPFILGTVEVYGKDSTDAPDNTLGGELVFDIISGNPLDNPITMIPPIAAAVVAGVIVALLKFKKRT